MPAPSDAEASLPSPAPLSVWARRADDVALGLLLLALTVAITGGGRFVLWGHARLALTDPWRLLAAAVVIMAARHVGTRTPSMAESLLARLQALASSAATRAALRTGLSTRLAVLLVGFFAVLTIGFPNERPPSRFDDNEFVNLQGRWDAGWYLQIATDGYRHWTSNPATQENIVFFPALPMALRVVGRLLGGTVPAYMAAGTMLVFVAFVIGLAYLYRLARETLDSEESAHAAVLLLAAYPFAVYFSAIYTESFYLAGAVGTWYHFRRREWLPAAAWGLLVGLTRPNGCFLSIPLAVLLVSPWLPRWLAGGQGLSMAGSRPCATASSGTGPTMGWREATYGWLAAAAPGVGVLLFCVWTWGLTGDPIAWARGHAAWGRSYVGLLTVIRVYGGWLTDEGLYTVTTHIPLDVLNLCGALFVLALTVPVWRRLGLAAAVFILVNMLPPIAAGGALSDGRLSAVMFPVFLWLASAVPARQRPHWVTAFAVGQGLCAALFYTWRELF